MEKTFWQRGDSNQRRRYQYFTAMLYPLDHHDIPKKGSYQAES